MTSTDLTPKQQHILAALRDEPNHALTVTLLAARLGSSKPDSMRRMLERLAERRLVRKQGRGSDREFVLTSRGGSVIGDLVPEPIPDSRERMYYVLRATTALELVRDFELELTEEQATHLDHLEAFVPVLDVKARNAEDALRQVATQVGDRLEGTPMMVAVSDRYWQPVPVSIENRPFVTVG